MRNKLGLLALLLTSVWLLGACERKAVELQLIEPRLDVDKVIAEQLKSLLDADAAINVTLVEPPDPDKTALETLIAGTGDLALVFNNEKYHHDVATVAPLYPTVLHIAHRSNLRDLGPEELFANHNIFAGPPGSITRRMVIDEATRLGIAEEDITFIFGREVCPEVITVFAPVEIEVEGRMSDLAASCGDFELRSLSQPEQLGQGSLVEGVTLLNPRIRPFIIPIDTYGDFTPTAIVTVAVEKMLVARADLPDTVVYDLLRELLRIKPALSGEHPGMFNELNDSFDVSNSAFAVHPGALAYIERDAPSVYERYSGVAEVAVTVFIGLLSGAFAMLRIYQIRRKNRIDVFYSDAIAIRSSVQGSTDVAVRKKAILEVRKLQNKAFDMLVQEKLAADESFRIFITLSNDVISELSDTDRL